MPEKFDEQALLLESLAESVKQARSTVEAGRQAMETRIEQAEAAEAARKKAADEETHRKNRNTLVIAGVIAGGALLIALFFSLYTKGIADDAHQAADTAGEAVEVAEAEREARTVGSCDAAREAALNSNNQDRAHLADVQADIVLFSALIARASGDNPEGIALGEQYVEDKRAVMASIVANQERVRICTDEAIEAYFNSGGSEGIEPPLVTIPGDA